MNKKVIIFAISGFVLGVILTLVAIYGLVFTPALIKTQPKYTGTESNKDNNSGCDFFDNRLTRWLGANYFQKKYAERMKSLGGCWRCWGEYALCISNLKRGSGELPVRWESLK